ncbi:type IV pilin protein [Demequina sp. NBRC 110051]|uniref:type IV pilin protein n=1 Tax=Demequina sp. NBRC 110051 TaxID=1570340 RepID=UPI0021017ACB|nr:prepilin-type N-terminal cleavage/methylation domain-containing protein [Demequina sp. NBRC 110051]
MRGARDQGMTLPELLVVMAIVAILVAVALPLFLNQQAKAYDSTVQSDLANVAIAVRTHVDESHTLPTLAPSADGYEVDGDRVATSPGVVLSAISGSADSYCFTASHPNGNVASNPGYRYTVTGGVEEGGCP